MSIFRSMVLAVAGALVVWLVLSVAPYNTWIRTKIAPATNFSAQLSRMDLEQRRSSRYGYSYLIYREIAEALADRGGSTLLLPPENYLLAHEVTNFKTVEPALFYYFTGLNSVTISSPNVWLANCTVISREPGKVSLAMFGSRKQADSQIAIFRQYR